MSATNEATRGLAHAALPPQRKAGEIELDRAGFDRGKAVEKGPAKIFQLSAPAWRERRGQASAFGPAPLGFIFRNLLGGGVLLGFEGLHFEDLWLIDGSMVQLDIVLENLG
jgi:hypothetical protein